MNRTNKGLFIAERICFILASIVFFVSTFMPLFAYKLNGSVLTTSYISSVGGVAYYFALSAFIVGFALIIFGDKKHFLFASALTLSAPLLGISVLLSDIVDLSTAETAYKINIGGILLFLAAGLYLGAYILHAIASMLGKEISSLDIDRRIEAVKAYKQYLEEGLINEEEYEKKKNEILGLSKKETKK